jgi:hypothetical protein
MSNSLRFLGFAVLAWAGVRAASLSFAPGMTAPLVPVAKAATLPPVATTSFDPPPPPDPLPMQQPYPGMSAGYGPTVPGAYPPAYAYPPANNYPPAYYPRGDRTIVIPASWPAAPASHPVASGWDRVMPTPQPLYYVPMGNEPGATGPGASTPPMRVAGERSAALPVTRAGPPRFDRLQLTAWALLRGTGKGTIPTTSLASGGTLGGSQAGARLMYRFDDAWTATLRTSSSVGGVRGAEVAGGVRWQPFRSIPIAITAERREGLGRFGGRSAFAVFAEGGLYHRALFNKVYLDGYIQGGVVGFNNRDLFVDGGATLSRPIWRNISGGVGVWGAAQPGLYRLDAGPRITMQVRRGIKVHADYRLRLIGNAAPPSGPAVTLAADF